MGTFIASNGAPYLQMRSARSHSTSIKEKEREKGRMTLFSEKPHNHLSEGGSE